MNDIYKSFELDFQKTYRLVYKNSNFSVEPMPDLTNEDLGRVLSIVSSCLMRNKIEGKNLFWMSSYIAIHIATSQILENGNKRLSLIALCFFLFKNGNYLVFERNYYATTIRNLIEVYQLEEGDRSLFIENNIQALASEIEHNVMPWELEEKKSFFEMIKNLIPIK